MKFKVNEDVDAPLDMVWSRFTDFSSFESDVRKRGVELTRVGNWSETTVGVEWRGTASVRGKKRAIAARVGTFHPTDLCVIESRIGGMDCHYELSFISLGPEVTRVALVLDLSAKTLTARLLLQTLKLARGRVMQRIQSTLARQGNAAEAAYRRERNA